MSPVDANREIRDSAVREQMQLRVSFCPAFVDRTSEELMLLFSYILVFCWSG